MVRGESERIQADETKAGAESCGLDENASEFPVRRGVHLLGSPYD